MLIGLSTLRALSLAFLMASATSLALPKPRPTLPILSPETTSAEKLKRRPPLTTLAQRLMKTTFSESSLPSESVGAGALFTARAATAAAAAAAALAAAAAMAAAPWPPRCRSWLLRSAVAMASERGLRRATGAIGRCVIRNCYHDVCLVGALELEAAFTRGIGEGFDFSVVEVAAAVEDHGADVGALGALGEELADLAGRWRRWTRPFRTSCRGWRRKPGSCRPRRR